MKLAELKKWFSKQDLKRDLQLNAWTYIPDLEATTNSYITLFEAQQEKDRNFDKKKPFDVYVERVREIARKLKEEKE